MIGVALESVTQNTLDRAKIIAKADRASERALNHFGGYVAKAGRFYLASSLQAEDGELAEFNTFARSFKLLHEAPPDEGSGSGSFIGRVILGATVSLVVVLFMQWRQRKAARKGEKAEAAADDKDDEDDDTDAFKPKPIKDPLRSRKGPEPIEPQSRGKTRRDAPRPEKPLPDEDSKKRGKPKAR